MIQLTWVDYSIVLILCFSIIVSLVRGFVREALSLSTWIIAIWLGIKFSSQMGSYFTGMVGSEQIRVLMGFGIVFILSLIGGGLVSYLVSQLVHKTGLSGTDRVLGMIFGLGRGVLLVSLVVIVLSYTSIAQEPWYTSSVMITRLEPMTQWLKTFMPERFNLPESQQSIALNELTGVS